MATNLPSTINEPGVERRIRRAFRQLHRGASRRPFETVYEHGHWWVLELDAEDQLVTWDAVDASGPGSVLGFSFEQVG